MPFEAMGIGLIVRNRSLRFGEACAVMWVREYPGETVSGLA